LKIALIVDAVIPALLYGGTERQVYWLACELLRRGHEVTVVARPGSFVPGARMVFAASRKESFSLVPADVDIVNAHAGTPPEGFGKACIMTSHGNGTPPTDRLNWSFVSRDHAARHGRRTFVYNGLPPEEHYFSAAKSDRLLFFSRINRASKNVTKAMQLAIRHDFEMDLAGGRCWELLTRSKVRQEGAFRLAGDPRFRFHGMLGGWEKAPLFAEARALLFPIRGAEAFGLVVIEALLAGTPVIASPLYAMPELITPEVGFLCESDEDFEAAFAGLDRIDPRACRAHAAERFSIARSAEGYLELYERVLAGERLD
jgi:glycosyltransferase involved in cell wall biosynthesis